MNRQVLKKSFVNSSIFFIFLVVIDFIIELFQINESSTVVTLFGIKIITHMTSKELTTSLGVTSKLFFWYVIMILIWSGGALLVSRVKKR